MKRILSVFLLTVFLAPSSAIAQVCDALNSLQWILGEWVAQDEKHFTYETWTSVSAQTYEGEGTVTLKATGEVRSRESLRLVAMSGEIFMIPKAEHNTLPIAFRLTSCLDDTALFENKAHDFPRQLKYQRVGEDSLHVYVSDGDSRGFAIRFRRVVDSMIYDEVGPPEECKSLWAQDVASEFVNELVRATSSRLQVWGGYDLGDGVYVLNAGESEEGNACLGIWRSGKAMAYSALSDKPTLNTALYGIYYTSNDTAEASPWAATQPASVSNWLKQIGIERAVILPVEVEDFPIKMSALVKTQLAIHEGFHANVQMPQWQDSTANGEWPLWDRQPHRSGIQACYSGNDEIKSAIGAERKSLVNFVEALLDSDTTLACQLGNDFLDKRMARYLALADVSVEQHDGTPGNCADAEAIMELEEGAADYASWSQLYKLGLASRENLLRRYKAEQKDLFYLTGAMQLHALSLMFPDDMEAIIKNIAISKTPRDGAPTSILKEMVDMFCR